MTTLDCHQNFATLPCVQYFFESPTLSLHASKHFKWAGGPLQREPKSFCRALRKRKVALAYATHKQGPRQFCWDRPVTRRQRRESPRLDDETVSKIDTATMSCSLTASKTAAKLLPDAPFVFERLRSMDAECKVESGGPPHSFFKLSLSPTFRLAHFFELIGRDAQDVLYAFFITLFTLFASCRSLLFGEL